MDSTPPDKVSASDPPRRKRRRILSVSVMVAFVLGILFVAVFNTVMDYTNTEEFCIGCHEMKETTYREYTDSVHFSNRTGVRAVCVDCHLPKAFFPKIFHKIKASNDIWHSMLGTIDTPEKFEERRVVLAKREWMRLKKNNSRECLGCHDPKSFDFSIQGKRAAGYHQNELMTKGQTCIDCHKGIVHTLPDGYNADSNIDGTSPNQETPDSAAQPETADSTPPSP